MYTKLDRKAYLLRKPKNLKILVVFNYWVEDKAHYLILKTAPLNVSLLL